MRVDILYFEGCPNAQAAFDVVREVASELGLEVDVGEVEVSTDEQAVRLRFLGSPTVQVDGVDVEPAARERTEFSFSCRMYGSSGRVPRDLVRSALLAARGRTA
jgi:hypothetical protein